MLPLRLIGFICGLVCVLLSIRYMTTYRRRSLPTPWLITGSGLLILSIFPDTISIFTNFFNYGNAPLGRLVLISSISVMMIWFIILYEQGKRRWLYDKFEILNHNLAMNRISNKDEFIEKYTNAIVILIPAYNEANNLDVVLERIPDQICGRIVCTVVINDGSDDLTAEIAESKEAFVITHLVNMGGGAALKTGYRFLAAINPSVVVTMDADGQHLPEEISKLVVPILDEAADFVIGSRTLGSVEKYSNLRTSGVYFFSWLINLLVRTKVTDCSSGFRAFSPAVFKTCSLSQLQYHTAELIIEAAKHGFRISEVPIHIKARISGESKKGANFFYALHFLKSIVSAWIR